MKRETKFWLMISGLIVVSAGIGLYFVMKAKNKKIADNTALEAYMLQNNNYPPPADVQGINSGAQNIGKTLADSFGVLFKKKKAAPKAEEKATTSYADTLKKRAELSDVPSSSNVA